MFIGRRADNTIYGTWTVKQWDGQEELPDDHPEVVAFTNRPMPTRNSAIEARLNGVTTIAELKAFLRDVL